MQDLQEQSSVSDEMVQESIWKWRNHAAGTHTDEGEVKACHAYRALQSSIACKAQISSYGIQRSVDNPQMVAKG